MSKHISLTYPLETPKFFHSGFYRHQLECNQLNNCLMARHAVEENKIPSEESEERDYLLWLSEFLDKQKEFVPPAMARSVTKRAHKRWSRYFKDMITVGYGCLTNPDHDLNIRLYDPRDFELKGRWLFVEHLKPVKVDFTNHKPLPSAPVSCVIHNLALGKDKYEVIFNCERRA